MEREPGQGPGWKAVEQSERWREFRDVMGGLNLQGVHSESGRFLAGSSVSTLCFNPLSLQLCGRVDARLGKVRLESHAPLPIRDVCLANSFPSLSLGLCGCEVSGWERMVSVEPLSPPSTVDSSPHF